MSLIITIPVRRKLQNGSLITWKKKKQLDDVSVSATYSVNWMFRNYPGVHASWMRWEERSMEKWDYTIVVNRYIPPSQLKNGLWPPGNAIHIINVDGKPICAVLKRNSGYDLAGYEALQRGSYTEAADYFSKAVKEDDTDEMIFYNFAAALYKSGNKAKADSMLEKSLELNPDFDLALMYKGNVARADDRLEEAKNCYEKLIRVNRKYFEAYVSLAELIGADDVRKARELLRTCLRINPDYKPALAALGDTYSKSDPEIARKYYEKAKTTININ
ncbi:MAG TPA: tetratricopeptide repeat protein [Bacteroidales bacterium]|nr:tetratricopeptide repeat protein [Bacteroidales bacterium]